jgi:general secretion pathway protein D
MVLAGCAGQQSHKEGMALFAAGNVETGLSKLEDAKKAAPNNLEFKIHYLNARDKVIAKLLDDAAREQALGHFDDAEKAFNRILELDRNNSRANIGIAFLTQARSHAKLLAEASHFFAAGDTDRAEQKLSTILQENPQQGEARTLLKQIEEKSGRDQVSTVALKKTFQKPVTLEFRDANLKQVLEALSRHSGLNFMLDKDVPANLTITTFLRQVSIDEALEVILSTNGLSKRILNETTLLIYPDTAAKQSQHQDLVVRTFYLSNASAKEAMNMLKTVLKAKNLYVDEKLNLLIMRDTPETIQIAERLVAAQDVSDPEVMLEVEVLEVQRSKLLNLGIQFPDQLTLTPLPAATTLTVQDLKRLTSSTLGATISPAVINLTDQVNNSNILANPRIRTRSKEKAEIKIGDRVPVVTTTSTSTGFVADSIQYVDVGLKLNVEPTIFPDDQIAIKVMLEVSSVVKQITTKNGTLAYQIGTRNASTTLRLKDGETQILGGLISDSDTTAANRIPGLGDFPVLGRLFSTQNDNTAKTELVLSITPRLIRSLSPPLLVPSKFWSGTENNPRLKSSHVNGTVPEKVKAALPVAPQPSTPLGMTQSGITPINTSAEPAVATTAAIMHWEGANQVKSGDNLKLALKISSQSGIVNLPLQIKYDPECFSVVDVSPGTFMAQGDIKADFNKRILAENGMIFVTQNRSGSLGSQGEGEVLQLELHALKPVQNSLITVLPTVPLGLNQRSQKTTDPVPLSITVAP